MCGLPRSRCGCKPSRFPQPAEADLVGLKENQRINPMQSKFAPAEGVTPPAEVHACPTVHSAPCTTRYRCLPTGVTGSRSRPTPPGFGQIVLCRPDPWVRVSFAHTPVSILGWIYDPDHSLPPGMYVDVPHLDCLLVAAPITLEGLDQLILKPKQLDGIFDNVNRGLYPFSTIALSRDVRLEDDHESGRCAFRCRCVTRL